MLGRALRSYVKVVAVKAFADKFGAMEACTPTCSCSQCPITQGLLACLTGSPPHALVSDVDAVLAGIAALASSPHLSSLSCAGCSRVTGACLRPGSFAALTRLDLSRDPLLGHEGACAWYLRLGMCVTVMIQIPCTFRFELSASQRTRLRKLWATPGCSRLPRQECSSSRLGAAVQVQRRLQG